MGVLTTIKKRLSTLLGGKHTQVAALPEKTAAPVSLWLDQRIVNVAYETFAYMLKNYHTAGVIDHAAWIINDADLQRMISMLEPYVTTAHRGVNLQMSTDEQDDFVRLLDYAGFAAQTLADRVLLEMVYEACSDDGYGKDRNYNDQLYIVLEFTPEELSAHNRVFQKMIDDPECIDNSMYDLTEWDKFVALVAKLKQIDESTKSPVVVPMTFSEWATYSSYSSHAFDLDDGELTEEEETAMSKVMSFNSVILRGNARIKA
ncbi:hypothetical protein Q7C_1564 [Methylophaga frappieri]|uniref:Uncharacterized protein n=1 Tax=Methylophaga frappieri (strain ATCC BAA-2434 / DSM 25690 / JAM7) TaxID=754477 RepID=I1YIH0_METFJ|nr:hypothetical protein [Methylophaga frappieri]AFJ02713.1 hypothetical protein Q7C_1564 [Methylophaga frappieri]